MKLSLITLAILTMVAGDDEHPWQSEPWVCSGVDVKLHANAIHAVVMTHGVPCFDDLLAIPGELAGKTPFRSDHTYGAVGPFIGGTRTFRITHIDAAQIDTIDLGTKLPDEMANECLACNITQYAGEMTHVECETMECPERISKELHWNPPGNVTFESHITYCSFRREGSATNYYCKNYATEHPFAEDELAG